MITGDTAAVLLVLRARPGAITTTDLARLSGTSADRIDRVLARLHDDQLVHRFPGDLWGGL